MTVKPYITSAALSVSALVVKALIHAAAYAAFILGCIWGGARVGWHLGTDSGQEEARK